MSMMPPGGPRHISRKLIHQSAWKKHYRKFAPDLERWHHACGGEGCLAEETAGKPRLQGE
jgi:hypothetical protein